MRRIYITLSTYLLLGIFSGVSAAPVDLSTWAEESYPAVSGFSPGDWQLNSDNTAVTQVNNGQPTMFYSDFNAYGTEITGSITVNTNNDDDFIGFMLGYEPDDINSTSADYLLIDWKQGTQSFNFGSPSDTPGSTADEGLAVSRVTGIPTADEFWGHTDFIENPDGGVEELARGVNLGSTGWITGQTYDFTFDFGPSNLLVYVDGALEFDLTGSFDNGRLAFYNFSQEQVTYSGFTSEQGSFSVPEPATMALFLGGLAGLFSRRLIAG